MVDPKQAADVDPFAALEARLAEQFDDDGEMPSLDYARSDDEAEAEIRATMARLRERAANPPEPEPSTAEEVVDDLTPDPAPIDPTSRAQSTKARSHGLRIIDEDLDLDTGLSDIDAEQEFKTSDRPLPAPAEVDPPRGGTFGALVADKPESSAATAADDDDTLFDDDYQGMWTDESTSDSAGVEPPEAPEASELDDPDGSEASDALDLSFEPSDLLGLAESTKPVSAARSVPNIPGSSVPATRLATREQMAAASAQPAVLLKVSDTDPNLPGARHSGRPATAPVETTTLGAGLEADPLEADPLANDPVLGDTMDIPDRERPPVAVYLLLTVLTLAALGALLWYTNSNSDDLPTTNTVTTPADSVDTSEPATGDAPEAEPASTVGVRMDEAIPLISTAVDRCDKNGLLGTIVSSAASRVQLDLKLQFLDADGAVYYEAARATGGVDPAQAVTFTFLLLGEPVPAEFAGVDPVNCRLEVTGVFGA